MHFNGENWVKISFNELHMHFNGENWGKYHLMGKLFRKYLQAKGQKIYVNKIHIIYM